MAFTFYLGTHKPCWLWRHDVPLFVSHRTLRIYKTLHPARASWALDSGGFSELSLYGQWRTTPREYAAAVARYQRELGRLDWAAPQDWMTEPEILARTGLSLERHLDLTVANFLELERIWPEYSDQPSPFVPVVQGRTVPDYIRCISRYVSAGVRLNTYPVVGIGSVCRRQGTAEMLSLFRAMRLAPRLHGFGVKTQGLRLYGRGLASADSMAWSVDARRSAPLPGHRHSSCSNCAAYALRWRSRLLESLAESGHDLAA